MKARLVGISGWDETTEIDLPLPVILGRSRSSGIVIKQPLVSRQHCELFELEDRLMIRDLGSTNGTRVNQVRIEQPTELVSGDLVTIGSVTFRVDCGAGCSLDKGVTLTGTQDETAVDLAPALKPMFNLPSEEFLRAVELPFRLEEEVEVHREAECLAAVAVGKQASSTDPESALTALQTPEAIQSGDAARRPTQ